MPVVSVDADTLDERRWRRVAPGEQVKTWFQAYILMPPRAGWRLSTFWTSDNQRVTGRTAYRAPSSLTAWCEVVPQVTAKAWRHWFSKTPSP